MPILGPDGNPLAPATSNTSTFKKAPSPIVGEKFGDWTGSSRTVSQSLMRPGFIQFNLDQLTIADYRLMRDHYQVNASLSVLTFMLYQMDWKLEGGNAKAVSQCEENLREVWTRLVRAMSQSFWAGFSPNVLQWENDVAGRQVKLTKVKDLLPEDCTVHWKTVDGYKPPGATIPKKLKIYDGIDQWGWGTIPVQNSLWYPLLMENGNMYGRKILRSAFVSYFFSILMHLFANRYFERFGEPVPIGRAPFDENIENTEGVSQSGGEYMEDALFQLRSRSVVVLPGDRDPETKAFDYDIQYLESQMRGADFERYLLRLDEEISLAIFTPLLMLRTGETGSTNLGLGQMQVYLWMLNAIAGDWAEYINRYILAPMVRFNFSESIATKNPVRIVFRRMGKENVETTRAIINQLMTQGRLGVDVVELGQAAGLTLKEIEQVVDAPAGKDARVARNRPDKANPESVGDPAATGGDITARIARQVDKAFRENNYGEGFKPSLGYHRQMREALERSGITDAESRCAEIFGTMDRWLEDVIPGGTDIFANADEFMTAFKRLLRATIERASR